MKRGGRGGWRLQAPVALAAVLLTACDACGRSRSNVADGGALGDDAALAEPLPPPLSKEEADLWAHASDDDADPFERLIQHVGCADVMERVRDPKLRPIAIQALAFCSDFSPLLILAGAAASGSELDARLALASLTELAARPRPSIDPEDALELRAGCDRLLALVKSNDVPMARRRLVVPVLRMLGDRGCAKPADLAAVDVR